MEIWTLKETATNTRMSEAFWRKQIWLRRVSVIKIGRSVRLDAETVRSFLAARTRAAKPEATS
jgi:hypothetical protein